MAFHAAEVALMIGDKVKPVVAAVKKHDADLADQIYRAAKSVVLNVPEGGRRFGKDRNYSFRIGAGSCAELRAGVRFAISWGYCEAQDELLALCDRELAMLWKLERAPRSTY